MQLYTIGYGQWPPRQRLAALLQALTRAGVTTLVDIRHAPCAASLAPQSHYGPRDWYLQPGSSGIAPQVERQGMEYLWLVELGNPQQQDPTMAVLRAQLASADEKWPVNRELKLLLQLVQTAGKRCCLLCACKAYDTCHRNLIAESLRTRWLADTLEIRDLSGGRLASPGARSSAGHTSWLGSPGGRRKTASRRQFQTDFSGAQGLV